MIPGRLPFLTALLVVSTACSIGGFRATTSREAPASASVDRGELEELACRLGGRMLQRTANGYYPDRSGDIQIIPEEPATFGVSHSGPWGYLQGIPMFWYGPGHVPALGPTHRRVTMADVAPTIAEHLRFRFSSPDGTVMKEAVSGEADEPPKLVVVIVWDGGGRNLLSAYPDAWPYLRSLIPKGVWFERATIGSSPSVTPPVHTTLGTGAFPRAHGVVDFVYRVDGRIVDTYADGPQDLMVPSLADEWDVATENRALVGMVAYKNWHLGMLGHGSAFEKGDRDIAVVVDERRSRWTLNRANQRFFALPAYLNDIAGLDEGAAMADRADGTLDGRYFGREELSDPAFLWRTPAFTWWQTLVLEEMIRREAFGRDSVTDLMFVNYKQIDQAGHLWTMNTPQMEAAVRASDRALEELVRALDVLVGRGRWVLALTADHGVTPDPLVSGAYDISKEELLQDIEDAFGNGGPGVVVQRFGRTHLWINVHELESRGYTLEQVSAFLAGYTKGENAADPSVLSAEEREERVFAAAFPSSFLKSISC